MDSWNSSNSSWYCIHTKRYKEQWVAQQLGTVCDEVYLPLLRQQRIIRRQLKHVIEPLFPNYLFACFPADGKYRAVRYTSGVIKVVNTQEGGPVQVDISLIGALRSAAVDGCIEVQQAPLSPGEELEVTAGPFQNLSALFQKELKAGERVAVLLDLLSDQVRVELPRTHVQKKSASAPLLTPNWPSG